MLNTRPYCPSDSVVPQLVAHMYVWTMILIHTGWCVVPKCYTIDINSENAKVLQVRLALALYAPATDTFRAGRLLLALRNYIKVTTTAVKLWCKYTYSVNCTMCQYIQQPLPFRIASIDFAATSPNIHPSTQSYTILLLSTSTSNRIKTLSHCSAIRTWRATLYYIICLMQCAHQAGQNVSREVQHLLDQQHHERGLLPSATYIYYQPP